MSYKLVVERSCPKKDWKIGQFENVFPLFVTEIQTSGSGKKVEFTISAKSVLPPALFVRTYSNINESEDCSNSASHKYVQLTHEETSSKEVEKSSKFEQFVYIYNISETDVIDLVCLAVEDGHIELNSFAIDIIDE